MTPPREPDRFEAKARELDRWIVRHYGVPEHYTSWPEIAAALRAAESSALDRAAQLVESYCSVNATGFMASRIRALASPAAAPAAECTSTSGTIFCNDRTCTAHGKQAAPPSEPAAQDQDEVAMFGAFGRGEPAAPAPPQMDEDGCCVVCGRGLEPCYACEPAPAQGAEARIAELEAVLRQAQLYVNEYAGQPITDDLRIRIAAALGEPIE